MTVGHALAVGAWRLVTAVWRAQRSFWWPGKVHSLGSVNRSRRGCYSVAARVQRLGALHADGALRAKSTYLGLGQRSRCS